MTTRPALILKAYKNNLQNYPEEIKRRLARRFNDENNRLKSHAKLVEVVHPKNTIKRGFTITRTADGKLVRDTKTVQPGEELRTTVSDGVVKSTVKKTD